MATTFFHLDFQDMYIAFVKSWKQSGSSLFVQLWDRLWERMAREKFDCWAESLRSQRMGKFGKQIQSTPRSLFIVQEWERAMV